MDNDRPINKPPPLFYARHFTWLARALKVAARELGLSAAKKRGLVDQFAKHLKDTNPRFDEERFRHAAGDVEEEIG